jgi:hypothetical protein
LLAATVSHEARGDRVREHIGDLRENVGGSEGLDGGVSFKFVERFCQAL